MTEAPSPGSHWNKNKICLLKNNKGKNSRGFDHSDLDSASKF